jgi:nucleoside phosphorylase
VAAVRPILIAAAWDPELAPLHARLGPERARTAAGVITRAVGVGLVEAAAGTARAIAELAPRAVLLIGTAGVYRDARAALALGGAVVIRKAFLASSAVAAGAAYLPAPLPASVAADAVLRRALARASRAPVADVACPIGITRSLATARRLAAATGAALENLEVFAAARAAAQAGLPFAAVLGVSNLVGPQAHAEWRARAPEASAAACAAVAAWLVNQS